MIRAVIDIGTNSVKFCLGNFEADRLTILKDVNFITKLGEGLRHSGIIQEAAMLRTASCVAEYVKEARAHDVKDIKIVGTMALRSASNSTSFLSLVKHLTDMDVCIISGEDEAKLSFLAALSGISGSKSGRIVTFDTGGGSTEFVFGEDGAIERQVSINIGALRITEDYFPVSPVAIDKLKTAMKAITKEISESGVRAHGAMLIGMGGNITSMASVKHSLERYDSSKVHGTSLSLEEVNSQIESYAAKSLEERRQIKGLNPARADIILAGACIVTSAMELCSAKEVVVSDRGLRHVLLENFDALP